MLSHNYSIVKIVEGSVQFPQCLNYFRTPTQQTQSMKT